MERAILIRFSGSVEEGIKAVLETSGRPVSSEVFSFLLNLPSYKVCQVLARMERWGEVGKVTCAQVSYWKLK